MTPAEHEALSILSEECGEVIQVIGKIQRHGFDSRWPLPDGPTNRDLLEKELGHVRMTYRLLPIDELEVLRNARLKCDSIKPWLHHIPEENVDKLKPMFGT